MSIMLPPLCSLDRCNAAPPPSGSRMMYIEVGRFLSVLYDVFVLIRFFRSSSSSSSSCCCCCCNIIDEVMS
uniref:Uncharacterized protein n=1 Tax=Anopheles braziliensis TaxID=58242 RepID=A0A2M3ZLF7_9DIPT